MTVAFEERKVDGMLRKLALRGRLSELHRDFIVQRALYEGQAKDARGRTIEVL
jgi:hypothetical protein